LKTYHRHHATHGWKKTGRAYLDTGLRIKRILANLLKCAPSSIALTHNTSEGMNIVAQGLPLIHGNTVLGFDREYPANVYPWWNLAKRGVNFVRLEPTHSPVDFDTLEAHMDESVRVVAVSAVNWCSGFTLDLQRLGKLCRDRDILLVVDIAQALGIVPLHPEATGISAMAGSAWKWLMGPVGVGIFYCCPELLERLTLVFVGTDTVVDAGNYLDYDFTPKPDASRFEFSTPNTNDWVYLLASLELLEEIGFETIRERIIGLNAYLRDRLIKRGYRVLGSSLQEEQSGILTFTREDMDATVKVHELAAHNIVVSERAGGIRVSPHIFTSEEDLNRLFTHL
jgi:selenocysteine lyase/cysteine desulfurase